MQTGRTKFAVSLLVALVVSAPAAFPAPAAGVKLSGSIAGYVRNATGIPQMGASVFLFNRADRLIQRSLTNERGIFGFDALKPETYSIRVSLASFMPAARERILVQPGMQSLLYVDLASVLSSIELVYAAPGQGALMSDDWKLTLKGSAATRSVMRMLPGTSASDPSQPTDPRGAMFSETRGLFNVSAGDFGSGSAATTDLGTAFALATSIEGRNELQVSGNLGYNQGTAMPAAGFRTSYGRDDGGPEIALSVQQVYLPVRPGLGPSGAEPDTAPALRTMSLTTYNSMALTDNTRLDYGASLDAVSFLGRLDYSNKFARLTHSLGNKGSLQFALSSGAPPAELMVQNEGGENMVRGSDGGALAGDLAALAVLPKISLLDGRAALQRSQNFEAGYEKALTTTRFNVSVYHEAVSNANMTVVAPEGAFAPGDLMPDFTSNSSIVDAGSYERNGFAASMTQEIGDRLEIGTSFGRGGALEVQNRDQAITSADELRSKLQGTDRFWASARATTKLPLTHTQVTASYEWMNYSAIMPDHFYLTQNNYPQAGLNIRVRQPIPGIPGMPGRIEATAELRNGLAQGYLPVSQGGQPVLLIQTPRLLRGGLSFIF
jgi:Carboxypeptidase regulatory-like domain